MGAERNITGKRRDRCNESPARWGY